VLIDFAEVELHPCREHGMHYRLVSRSRRMSHIAYVEDVDTAAKENGELTYRRCYCIGSVSTDEVTRR
jgi:hypothetical protein